MQPHELKSLSTYAASPCSMDYLHLDQLGIGAIRLGHAHVDVGLVGDYHLMILCPNGEATLQLDQGEVTIGGTTAACIGPGQPFRGTFSPDCEQLILRIDSRLADISSGHHRTRFQHLMDLRRPALQPWLRLLDEIVSHRQVVDWIGESERMAADYQQLLIDLLLRGHEPVPVLSHTAAIAPASVRRAEDFIRTHYARSLRLEDIAVAADVPVRTLLDAFRQFRGQSPMRMLRDVRLDVAREQLLSTACLSVTETAMDAGFGHLGRFAHDYRVRFGETPSQTMLRAQQSGARRG